MKWKTSLLRKELIYVTLEDTGVPSVAQQVKNWHCLCEDAGFIPALAQWVKDLAGCRWGLDPVLLWLWYRHEAAALIPAIGQELSNAVGVAIKRKKKKKKKKKEERYGTETEKAVYLKLKLWQIKQFHTIKKSQK